MVLSRVFSCVALVFATAIAGCDKPHNITPQEAAVVKDNVQQTMAAIARDVSTKGPVAWLTYFERTPGFFMASEGGVAFADNKTAAIFINDSLPKYIRTIQLQWQNIKIDPLTTALASVGAEYHENITAISGAMNSEHGYFTAVAEKTAGGWQLRNLHWSVVCK